VIRSTLLSLALIAAPAMAAAPLYRAALENPAPARTIVKDVAWSCVGAACAAPRAATTPDANVCAAVARKLGRLVSFQVGERAFAATELEKCNSAAK
jgi:hypothetical protein